MMSSRDVRIWKIQINALTGRRKSYTVRWSVAGQTRSKTYTTRALADNFRSDLMQAVNRGEAFGSATGLPESLAQPTESVSLLDFAKSYVDVKWPGAAAKTRDSLTDALATVIPVLVREMAGQPQVDLMRRALREYALPPSTRTAGPPPDLAPAVAWLDRASLALSDLADTGTIRRALDAVALRIDGKPAAATTRRRKRSVLYNLLQYAVELDRLEYNPLDKLRVRSSRIKVAEVVDRRVVVNLGQARELLTAVTYVGRRTRRGERLMAFYACLYFAALRPGEALGLRYKDCHLPATCGHCGADVTHAKAAKAGCAHEEVVCGWGRLTLEKNRPQSAKRWTDSGETHDERSLKHRGEDEPRGVPIPPELVAILRAHVAKFGVAADGRLFASTRGNVVGASSYSRIWEEARVLGLPPHRVDSSLAGRPYDLRHAGVSLWLNAGVPAPEVAARAGHSVEVLLKVYAKCIEGEEATVNRRIEEALGGPR